MDLPDASMPICLPSVQPNPSREKDSVVAPPRGEAYNDAMDRRTHCSAPCLLILAGLCMVALGRRGVSHALALAFQNIECPEPPTGECLAQLERADLYRLGGTAFFWGGAVLAVAAGAWVITTTVVTRHRRAASPFK